jgi:general L-amino acid transport system permease protein
MKAHPSTIAYVRTEDAPVLPAPPSTVGIQGWLRSNLFFSPLNSVLTVAFGAFLVWYVWGIVEWALINAVWTGSNREACLGENIGACWPLVWDKFAQWIYGFYPIDQRWRVDIVFAAGVAALVPMLMPSLPYKLWNALFLLVVFPIMTLILLTGGNFGFSFSTYAAIALLFLLAATILPMAAWGIEDGIARNRLGLGLAAAAVVLWILSFMFVPNPVEIAGLRVSPLSLAIALFALAAGVISVLVAARSEARGPIVNWAIGLVAVLAAMLLLDFNFGLVPVETSQWGGLLVTLVVSVTGIVASLPIGILLALGRRSNMPVVRLFSVIFIELWRGVPLITVLFFSSVMLPLFLPEGVTFDKLLRALIGVALFSAAYMAEVVRSGLQAIPKGQFEGAMALGLSYWQMMRMIVLPQALKIAIPNIVGNFISLFKDTTLVSIIGLFDLLGMVRAGLKDPNWAAPSSTPTGYFALSLLLWIFCFGMSRYALYTERRLHTGHKR